jgi:hypothetical protein
MARSKGSGVSRREIFRAVGAMPAAAAVAAGAQSAPAAAKPAYRRKTFDEHQWRTVRVLCDLIIPADERSGAATAAGVPQFIDDWLDFRKREDGTDLLATQILGGLAWLDQESQRKSGKNFADAGVAAQKALLDRIAWPERAVAEDRPWVAFFNRFRDLTVGGFFSSRIGIADLPYIGNKAVAEWKGCDPEVWKIVEKRLG